MGSQMDFNYKEKIEVVQLTEVGDGYGGVTTNPEVIDTVYARVDKLVYDYREQAHMYYVDKGITFTSIYRLQHGTDIQFRINNIYYKLVRFIVQRRKFVYLCEEVM